MSTPTSDPSDVVADALNDFFGQLYTFCETIFGRLFKNTYASFANVSVNRWTKVILSVVGYIIVRPYIEKLFAHMHEKDRRKQQEKERAAAAAREGKTVKMSANELRGGGDTGGKVLGEVENTDDEIDDGEEEGVATATATGVSEMGKNARKRQKKQMKNLQKEADQRAQQLSEDQLMELLDWSESEEEEKKTEVKKDE